MSDLYNREEAYHHLDQIRTLNEKINMLIDERNDLLLMSTTTGSFDYSSERVQHSPSLDARFVITMEKYYDVEKLIDAKIDEYVEVKHKITEEISQLHKPEHIRILKMVFIEGKSVAEVVRSRNWRWKISKTHDVFNDALDNFYEVVLKK